MTDLPPQVRRALLGADGPEVRIPPDVAYWFRRPLIEWWRQTERRGTDSDLIRAHIAAIDEAAKYYEASLNGSASSADGTAPAQSNGDPRTLDGERWMTTAEAAEEWNIGVRAVRKRIDQGKVAGAQQRGGRWFIPAVEVERQSDSAT